MATPSDTWLRFLKLALLVPLLAFGLEAAVEPKRGAASDQAEVEFFTQVAREAQPAVAAMVGLPQGDPVQVTMMTRQELEQFLIDTIELEYPEGGLVKFGRCSAEIGLLPRGYDLASGMIDLVREQAGAVYDPYSKSLKGLLDLPPALKALPVQKLIVSHELCHALEDRVIDIAARSRRASDDVDYSYALRSTIEGIATVVMLAYSQNLPLDKLPDARAVMRGSFIQKERDPNQKTLADSPLYLRETLFSPYAEGSAFAQAWLKANPDLKLGAMLERMPVSAEQVLHFEKYVEGDEPTAVDVEGLEDLMPEGWSRFRVDTYGEFDLRLLFESHEVTRDRAADLASGWDGLRLVAFEDSSERLALVGASVWDTEADAAEFSEGFSQVLSELHSPGEFRVACMGRWVDFVVGPVSDEAASQLLAAVARKNRVSD
jgi:hypothetical protein